MTLIVSSTHDSRALTMTVVTELATSPERAWQLWADPRQLERWWGPPTYPATFLTHTLVPGSNSTYYMTGPAGERMHGWWTITSVDEPRRLTLDDGFGDSHGQRDESMPTTHMALTLESRELGTLMTIESRFETREHLEQLLAMGMEEGMTLALGQIEQLLVP